MTSASRRHERPGARAGTRLARLLGALAAALVLFGAAAAPLWPVSPAAAGDPSPLASAGAAAWNLEPGDTEHGTGRGNYAFAVSPGDTLHDTVIVKNSGTSALELGVYAADAYTTADGVLDLRLPGEPRRGAGAWIALSAPALHLEPGEAAAVPFTITVPADARPGDHPGGIVTSSVAGEAGEVLSVDRRLGIRVHLRVAGTLQPAVQVSAAAATFQPAANPFDGGTVLVAYTLTNTGDTRIVATDVVALAGPAGVGAVSEGPHATAEVLPGSSITVRRELDGVAALGWLAGSVTVAPTAVGVGAEALEPVTIGVSSPAVSVSLVALIMVIAGLAVGAAWVVRRRRARSAAAR